MADVRHITLNGVRYDIPIPGVMTGAGASSGGVAGLVPAPASGQQGRFLRGDGTWAEVVTSIDPMTGATASTAGTAGLVPAPSAGDQNKVLKGNGNWEVMTMLEGLTVNQLKAL